jgi:hypothetical protein
MFECSQNTNKCVNKKDIFFSEKKKDDERAHAAANARAAAHAR